MLRQRPHRGPWALLLYALAAVLLAVVASNGLYCAPAEQTSSSSSSRNESKEEKAKQTAQEEARHSPPKAKTEDTRRSTVKKKAEQPAAKSEPKPKPERGTHGTPPPYDATVTVVRVTDGDTIEISPAINGTEDVRLIGVDTPETVDPGEGVEPYGRQASEFATRELVGERVGVEFDVERVDQYDRLLAYVHADGSMFNEELVEKGYAQAYPYPPNTAYSGRFAAAQARARASGVGIWGLTTAQKCKLVDRGNGIGEGTPGCTAAAGPSPGSSTPAGTSATAESPGGGAVAPISEDDCPRSAPIKGNQSGLYHEPGGAYYGVTDPEECFAAAAEAEAAEYEASSR